MDCCGAYFTHVQTCDVTRVQSATEWTASFHTSHKAVMYPVFKVTEWTASVQDFSHVQTCDVTRVEGATEWAAAVHTSHMSKAVM